MSAYLSLAAIVLVGFGASFAISDANSAIGWLLIAAAAAAQAAAWFSGRKRKDADAE